MPWLQLSLTSDAERAPLLEAALENAGARAVTLVDAGDAPILEPEPERTPLWPTVRLLALFEDDDAGWQQATAALIMLAPLSGTPPRLARLPEHDWRRADEEHYQPRCFGRRLWVSPRARRDVPADAVVVELTPGLAFGTGAHPSTALCLEWLDAQSLIDATVLDYGCGSGILAIAALKLGARWALAVDHDPQALEATRANAAINGVADRIEVRATVEGLGRPVAVAVANILAEPLIALAPDFARSVAAGGSLLLAGLLETQEVAVRAAYRRAGFRLAARLVNGDWSILWLRRRLGR